MSQISRERTDFLVTYRDEEDSPDGNLLKEPSCGQRSTCQAVSMHESQDTSNQRSDMIPLH